MLQDNLLLLGIGTAFDLPGRVRVRVLRSVKCPPEALTLASMGHKKNERISCLSGAVGSEGSWTKYPINYGSDFQVHLYLPPGIVGT